MTPVVPVRMRILTVTLDNENFVLRWRFASAASHSTPSLCKLGYAIKVTASMLNLIVHSTFIGEISRLLMIVCLR